MLLALSNKQRLLLPLLNYAALIRGSDSTSIPRFVKVVSTLPVQAIYASLT